MKRDMEVDRLDDLDMAKQVVVLLEQENERLHQKLVALTKEIAALRGEDKTRQLTLKLRLFEGATRCPAAQALRALVGAIAPWRQGHEGKATTSRARPP